MSIGNNIKIIREKLNLSQKSLAEIFRVSARMIRLYEKDEYPVNSDALESLIKKYDINPTWLFLNKGNMLLSEDLTEEYINILKNKFNIDDEEINYIIKQAASSTNTKQAILEFLKISNSLDKENFIKIRKIFNLIN